MADAQGWVGPASRCVAATRAIADAHAWVIELHNDVSLQAHAALGVELTERLQVFRKRLGHGV